MNGTLIRKNIWFVPSTWRETKDEAMDRGQSPSEFINDLLEEHLSEKQPTRSEAR